MIYFIQVMDPAARIKIGYTTKAANRLASIRAACPYQVKFLGQMEGDLSTEKALHERFAEHAVIGEWFEPAPELMAFCSSLDQQAPNSMGTDYASSDIFIRFRVPAGIYEELTKIASYRNFSFRAAMVSVLEDALARREKQK